MASKDFDFDNFDMDDSSFGDLPKKNKGITFFKDISAGFLTGSIKKIGQYAPIVEDMKESAKDMTEEIRQDIYTVKTGLNKLGDFGGGIVSDAKKTLQAIKQSKGIIDAVRTAEAGFNEAKKNLAYKIDPEAAASFDFDAGMDDFGGGSSGGVSAGKSTSKPTSSSDLGDHYTHDMFMDDGSGGAGGNQLPPGGGTPPPINVIIPPTKPGDPVQQAIMTEIGSRILAQEAKIFKQQVLLDNRRHLQMMNAFHQLNANIALQQKFNAEIVGPYMKKLGEHADKQTAQLTDVIALLRDANGHEGGGSPIRQMFGAMIGRDRKKNMLDFTTSYGGANFGAMYKHVKGKAKEQSSALGLDMIADMGGMLPMLLMGGGNVNFGQSVGKLLGGLATMPFKKQIMGIGDKMSSLVPSTMIDLYDKMKKSNNGMLNSIAEFLDIDTGSKSTVSLRTENKRVGFDMRARQAIIEIIPGYLASIESILSGSDKRHFDYDTGQFTTEKSMQARLNSQIKNAGMGAMSSTKGTMLKTVGKSGSDSTKADFDSIIQNIMTSGVNYNPSINTQSELDKFFGDVKNADSISLWQSAWDNMPADVKRNFNINLVKARAARNQELGNMSIKMLEDGTGSTLGASIIESKIKDLKRQRHDMSKLDGSNGGIDLRGRQQNLKFIKENSAIDLEIKKLQQVQSANGDASHARPGTSGGIGGQSPMQQLYNLLLDGIVVFPRMGLEPVTRPPRHLIGAKIARRNAIRDTKQTEENAAKAAKDYESLVEDIESREAEAKLQEFEFRRKSKLEQLGTTFNGSGGLDDILSKIPGGSRAKKLVDTVRNSRIGKGLFNVKTKIDAGLKRFDEGIDNLSSTTTTDAEGNKKSTGLGYVDMGAAVSGLMGSNAVKGIKSGASYIKDNIQSKEGRSRIMGDIHSGLDGLKEKFAAAKLGSYTVNQLVEKIKSPEGRKELEEYVKAVKDSKVEEIKNSKQFKDVEDFINTMKDEESRNAFFQSGKNKILDGVEKAKEMAGAAGSKVKSTGDAIVEGVRNTLGGTLSAGEQKQVDGTKPDALDSGMGKDAVGKSTKQGLALAMQGKLGLLDTAKVWMSGIMDKLNVGIFGSKEDKNLKKQGLLGKIMGNVKSVMDGTMKFLLGNKETGQIGFLKQVFAPAFRILENVRHKIASKLIIPAQQVGEALGQRMKWWARDFSIGIKNAAKRFQKKSRMKAAKASAKWAKKNLKRAKKGKGPIDYSKRGGLLNGIMMAGANIVSAPMSIAKWSSGRNMRKLLSQGKISQGDYDKWEKKYDAKQDAEQAKHDQNLENISKWGTEGIDWSRAKTPELEEKFKGFKAQQAALKKELDDDKYDYKQDKKNAKVQQGKNAKKIKEAEKWKRTHPGETLPDALKLTQDEEYAAMTKEQRMYRQQDDMAKQLKAEMDRQKENEGKERIERETKQAQDISDITEYVVDGKTPKGRRQRKSVEQKDIERKEEEAKHREAKRAELMAKKGQGGPSDVGISNGALEGNGVDEETGQREGSLADIRADARKGDMGKVATGLAALLAYFKGKKPEEITVKTDAKDGGFFGWLKDKFGGFFGLLGGGLMTAFGALVALPGMAGFLGLANRAGRNLEVFKQEGAVGGIADATGIDSLGDSNYDRYTGEKKTGLKAAGDRFKMGRFLGVGAAGPLNAKNAVKMIKGGGKIAVKGVKKMASSALKLTPGGGLLKKGAQAAAKGAGGIAKKLTAMIGKILEIPAIKSKLGPKLATTMMKELPKRIGAQIGKSAVTQGLKQGASKVLGFLTGGIAIAVMAAADFGAGMADAARWFKIPKGETVTMGMRLASGLANTLNNQLLLGLVPMDWLVGVIYNFTASDEAKAKYSEMQERRMQRAADLGVDADRLNEFENKTLGQKFTNLFRSQAGKDARDAKLLGFGTVEEYQEWKKQYDQSVENAKTPEQKAAEAEKKKKWDNFKSGVKAIPAKVKSFAKDVMKTAIKGIKNAPKAIAGGIGTAIGTMENFLNKTRDGLGKAVGKMMGTVYGMKTAAGDLIDYVKSGDAWADFKDKAKEVAGKAKEWVGSTITKIGDSVKNAMDQVTGGIKSGWEYITSGKLIEDVGGWVTNTFNSIKDWAKGAFDTVKNGLSSAGSWIADKAKGALDWVKGVPGQAASAFSESRAAANQGRQAESFGFGLSRDMTAAATNTYNAAKAQIDSRGGGFRNMSDEQQRAEIDRVRLEHPGMSRGDARKFLLGQGSETGGGEEENPGPKHERGGPSGASHGSAQAPKPPRNTDVLAKYAQIVQQFSPIGLAMANIKGMDGGKLKKIKEVASWIFNQNPAGQALNRAKTNLSGMWNAAKGALGKAKDFIGDKLNQFGNWFSQTPVGQAFGGAQQAIQQGASNVWDAARYSGPGQAISNIWNSITGGGINTHMGPGGQNTFSAGVDRGFGQSLGMNAAGRLVATMGSGGLINGAKVTFRDPAALNAAIMQGFYKPSSAASYLTQPFGAYTDGKQHWGIDIGSRNEGNTINRAIRDGTVVRVQDGFNPSWNMDFTRANATELDKRYPRRTKAFGNEVTVRMADGTYAVYAHQEKNFVNEGDTVKAGDPLGLMGNTGNSDGKHLHFQIQKNGKAYDPIEFLNSGNLSQANYPIGDQSNELTKPFYPGTPEGNLPGGPPPGANTGGGEGGGTHTPVRVGDRERGGGDEALASHDMIKKFEENNDAVLNYLKQSNLAMDKILGSKSAAGNEGDPQFEMLKVLNKIYDLQLKSYTETQSMRDFYATVSSSGSGQSGSLANVFGDLMKIAGAGSGGGKAKAPVDTTSNDMAYFQ